MSPLHIDWVPCWNTKRIRYISFFPKKIYFFGHPCNFFHICKAYYICCWPFYEKKRSQQKCPKIENTMWNDNALIDIRQLCFCGHFNAEKGYLVWYILFHWSKALVDDNPKLPTFPLKSSSIPPQTFKLYPNSRDVESAAVSGSFCSHPQKRLTLHFLKPIYIPCLQKPGKNCFSTKSYWGIEDGIIMSF